MNPLVHLLSSASYSQRPSKPKVSRNLRTYSIPVADCGAPVSKRSPHRLVMLPFALAHFSARPCNGSKPIQVSKPCSEV